MSYKPRAPGTLKDATDRLINAVGGGTRAADLTGWPKQQFYRYSDDGADNANVTIPVGIVRTLETNAGRPIVTEFLANEQGCIILKPVVMNDGCSLPELFALFAEATAQLAADAARAFSPKGDGGVEVVSKEAGRMLADLDAALSRAASLRAPLAVIRDGAE